MNLGEWTSFSSNLLPHGYCLLWQPGLLWTLVGSDAIIALSYFSIPLALLAFMRKQPSFRFGSLFAMFAAFILACGLTHVLEIANIWRPMYSLSAGVKAFTALVSFATAVALWYLMPMASDVLDHHRQLQKDLAQRNLELRDALLLLSEREQQIQRSEWQLRQTQKMAPIGITTVSVDGLFLSVNQALSKMLAYAEDELLGLTFQDITHPDDLDIDLAHVHALLDGRKDKYRMEKRYFDKHGKIIHVQLDVSLIRDDRGEPMHFISMIQDITHKKRSQAALRRSRARFKRLLDNMPTAVLVHNADTSIAYGNAAAAEMLGINSSELGGKTAFNQHWKLLNEQGQALELEYYPAVRVLNTNAPLNNYTLGIQHSSRPTLWAQVNAFLDPGEDQGEVQIIVALTDITERKTHQEELERQARTDILTGLYNRRHCMHSLKCELARAQRNQTELSIIMVDVDHFKRVNDRYGHEVGDRVLASIGDIFHKVVRQQDIACRIGGEEFLIILPQSDHAMACEAAERLRKTVEAYRMPQHNGTEDIQWTVSCGVSTLNGGTTDNELIQLADKALYTAKNHGRNRVVSAESGGEAGQAAFSNA